MISEKDKMALVIRAQGMTPYEVADLMITAESLRRWQIEACRLAQSGDFEGLADHLMLPSPDVKEGDRVSLEEGGKFYKIERIDAKGKLLLDNQLIIDVKQVFSVEPSNDD